MVFDLLGQAASDAVSSLHLDGHHLSIEHIDVDKHTAFVDIHHDPTVSASDHHVHHETTFAAANTHSAAAAHSTAFADSLTCKSCGNCNVAATSDQLLLKRLACPNVPRHNTCDQLAKTSGGGSGWIIALAVGIPVGIICIVAGIGIGAAAMRRKYLRAEDSSAGGGGGGDDDDSD